MSDRSTIEITQNSSASLFILRYVYRRVVVSTKCFHVRSVDSRVTPCSDKANYVGGKTSAVHCAVLGGEKGVQMGEREGRERERLAPCKWQELNDAKGIFKRHNYRVKLSVPLVPFVKFAFANLCPTAVRTSPASPTPFVLVPRSRSCQFSIVSVINSLIAIAFREDVFVAYVLVDYARETAVFRV